MSLVGTVFSAGALVDDIKGEISRRHTANDVGFLSVLTRTNGRQPRRTEG